MSSPVVVAAMKMLLLSAFLAPDQFAAKLDPVLAAKSQRIDVVSVDGKFSYAEYRTASAAAPEPLGFPVHTFTPAPIPFGDFRCGDRGEKKGCYAGYLIPLSRFGASVNLLAYHNLEITGRFTGTWGVAFADDALAVIEDNVLLATVRGSGTHRFDLKSLLERADLSRSRQIVLLMLSDSGSAEVDAVTFSHPGQPGGAAARAAWIWRRDSVLGGEDAVLRRLTEAGTKKVYLQVGDDPEVFAPFLGKAAAAGIEVYALDGSPSYVASPGELLQRIARVERYNASHEGARFSGFQIDVEPYLNKDYASRKGYYAERYVALLDEIVARYSLPLSVAVPFWFDGVHASGKSLLQHVFERADEVVVMSYRTDARAALEISRSALSLGERFEVPVRLGVELGPIPDERHQEFERCSASAPGGFRLGQAWWCKGAEYLVPGSRLSFKNRMQALPAFLDTTVPFASFGGWVLHSYEEFPPDL